MDAKWRLWARAGYKKKTEGRLALTSALTSAHDASNTPVGMGIPQSKVVQMIQILIGGQLL